MADRVSADMLYARLRALAPGVRTVLVAAARSSLDVSGLVDGLAEYGADMGETVNVVNTAHGSPPDCDEGPGSSGVRTYALASFRDTEEARRQLDAFPGFTLVRGSGLLDSADSLILAGAVDGVLLAVRAGSTERADLERVRVEVDRAGGKILAAALV